MNFTTAIVQLPLVREVGHERMTTPAEVARICADIRDLAQEAFLVLTVNAKNRLINRHLVTVGILDASLVHPREVFGKAIGDQAAAVIIVHNHPSGETTASAEDLRITRQLIEAGKILGINVLDHVIIGRPIVPDGQQPGQLGYLSIRESGMCAFV